MGVQTEGEDRRWECLCEQEAAAIATLCAPVGASKSHRCKTPMAAHDRDTCRGDAATK